MGIKNISILVLISMYISGSYGIDKIEKNKGKMSAFLNGSHVTMSDELSQSAGAIETDKGKKKNNFMCSLFISWLWQAF
jgi:hypothetical protein